MHTLRRISNVNYSLTFPLALRFDPWHRVKVRNTTAREFSEVIALLKSVPYIHSLKGYVLSLWCKYSPVHLKRNEYINPGVW